mmetsp:Transcript_52794/g.141396  ORF Transcript_52794/g.141396 Transcript_52794/m.141396 type:complete len:236 (-) Transcript_52794:431-1138(-)
MTSAVAPGKHSIAAPMAVSSCRTLVEALSRGSTVLEFFMTGRGSMPSFFANCSFSASRSTQRLLVLKNLYFAVSWKAFSSSSGHCADSRSSRPPPSFFLARWPPFLSASVRSATSIMKGAPVFAKCARILRSMVAPRLSEFDTNMYLKPFERSFSSVPLPSIAGYRSPWPGGHHSCPGSFSQVAGERSAAATFGALFCTNSRSAPVPSSGYSAKAARVSAEVEKEFMSMKERSVL